MVIVSSESSQVDVKEVINFFKEQDRKSINNIVNTYLDRLKGQK